MGLIGLNGLGKLIILNLIFGVLKLILGVIKFRGSLIVGLWVDMII